MGDRLGIPGVAGLLPPVNGLARLVRRKAYFLLPQLTTASKVVRTAAYITMEKARTRCIVWYVVLYCCLLASIMMMSIEREIMFGCCCRRPYHVGNTGSRPITEVKQRWARLVLAWVTGWEYRVLPAFCPPSMGWLAWCVGRRIFCCRN